MPNIVYTVPEKIEMVRKHAQGLSYQRIVDHFAAENPNRPVPSKSTVQNILKKFHATGNLDPKLKKLSYPKRQLKEEKIRSICSAVEEGSKKPISKIAQELGISKTSVHKVMQIHQYRLKKKGSHGHNNKSKIFVRRDLMNHPNDDMNLLKNNSKIAKVTNVIYTVAERIEMMQQHEQGLSYQHIVDHFAAAYPDRPIPSKKTVRSIVKRFYETGNLDPNLAQARKQFIKKAELNNCDMSNQDLDHSTSRINQDADTLGSLVNRVLQAQKYCPHDQQDNQPQSKNDQLVLKENSRPQNPPEHEKLLAHDNKDEKVCSQTDLPHEHRNNQQLLPQKNENQTVFCKNVMVQLPFSD